MRKFFSFLCVVTNAYHPNRKYNEKKKKKKPVHNNLQNYKTLVKKNLMELCHIYINIIKGYGISNF